MINKKDCTSGNMCVNRKVVSPSVHQPDDSGTFQNT